MGRTGSEGTSSMVFKDDVLIQGLNSIGCRTIYDVQKTPFSRLISNPKILSRWGMLQGAIMSYYDRYGKTYSKEY